MPSPSFALPALFLLFLFPFSSAHSFHDDAQSLLAFKKLITSDPHNSLANWSPTVPLCNWSAITCGGRHPDRIVAIDLSGMDLRGTVSPSLGNLSFLRSLDLSDNKLHGHIPPQLGRLFRLGRLWLDNNQLEGNIPHQLSSCRILVSLALSYNELSGNIPGELSSLSHLQELYLGANSLTGTIPSSLGNLSALIHLDMYENSLVGLIPPQLSLLTYLQTLFLYTNELFGSIPPSLSNISTLTDLAIDTNHFTGSIPQELGLLTHLQTLHLFTNELSGSIPPSLSNISTLNELVIYQNKLRGHIPLEFGAKLNNLNLLSLWGNQLSGNIPNTIGNCSKLEQLYLHYNKLSGSVPIELGNLFLLEKLYLHNNELDSGSTTTMPFLVSLTNCSHLQDLHLSDNKLSGVLPLSIGRLSTNLSYFSLANNKIQGNIPPHIGNLSSLIFLNLSGNFLNGTIQPFGNLTKLERLDLGNNELEGNITNQFEQLQGLGLLDISRNKLTGKIPTSLPPSKQLRRLLLHGNKLSGSIPTILGNYINLELLDLSHNMLTGSIPREIAKLSNLQFYLNLSWNLLDGSLPMEISKIAMAQAIDISSNHLIGLIPPTLGSYSELQTLNLSRNAFQGSIPDSLGTLLSLVNLDLSFNSLSGPIPVTLQKLKMLQCLNLSFNNLTGEIPKEGFFANQTIIMSFIGNPGLCGPKVFMLPACSTSGSHFAVVKKILFPMGGAIVFILCCLLLGFLWRRNIHVQNFDSSESIFQKLEHKRISFQELHIATNGFTRSNLLGSSSFGSVYKGILSDGTIVAVKVFQLQNDQGEKSFKAECTVLQKIRHRNLVRIITSCSNLHFKGLVFQFMSNGSLEKHLYHDRNDNNDEEVCGLGLKTLLNIAIDVTHAIEYLHHYSHVQVVHCDIKPSNVLLDEDMIGHVTDFGLARLIGADFGDSLTSTLTLKGSMGYIAPEYGLGERVSTKGDVYSYGIMLLEMLTRKRPTNNMFIGDLNMHKWVSLAFPNKVKEVIDNNLFSAQDGAGFEEDNIHNCLLSLLRVGLLCSKDSPDERPTMRDVVIVLENLKEDLMAKTIATRRSISNLLGHTNAPNINSITSNDQNSSTF
eukprot:PITA_11215